MNKNNDNDELLNSNERNKEALQLLHETIHSGMWSMTFDLNGNMDSCTWSNEFRHMIGYNDLNDFPDELESWSNLLHKDDKERVLNEFVKTINDYSGKTTYDVEYRLLTKWGEYRWFHAAGKLRRRKDGSPLEYIGLFVDVTDRIDANIALKQALEAANAASRAKSEFLSNMSHDIRTPMNAIVGMTTLATDHIDDKERVKDCLHKINISSKQLLGLINDILDMSKIESGKLIMNESLVSLKNITESICEIIRPQIKDKKQHFEVTVSNIISEDIFTDEVRLNQILLNFLSNAIKFSHEDGHISLDIYQEKSPKGDKYVRCHFTVTDDGIGMSKEFQKKIFKAFEREDNKRIQKTQGTGLGLTISKHIIDMMNGEVIVDSELGVGTSFHVIVDFEKSTVDDSHMKLPGVKILVVDDSKELCQTTIENLEKLDAVGDYALSGKEAIEKVKNNKYFAVLVDYKMQDMDGIECIKKLREYLVNNEPICLISAYDCSECIDKALKAGANLFIPKPLYKSTIYHELIKFIDKDKVKELAKHKLDLNGMNILLVEDQYINSEIMKTLLEDRGAIVDCAFDGKEGLDSFINSKENYYKLILMDLRMPNMNGFEATAAIRALKRKDAKTITIIALTADAFREDAKKCLDIGMNAHMAKPIDIDLLERTLEKLL